jgi:3-oxoacyl-[acyl-carrier protein] reductase
MSRFAGRQVLVTGASRGLGRAVAEAFAHEGARVGIGYHAHQTEARDTLESIERAGGSAVLLGFDVRNAGAVEEAFARFTDGGRLDVLVNSAATVCDAWAIFISPSEWEEVVEVNLTGTFNCCKAAARYMLKQRSGAIVNVGSVAGLRATPGQASYSASKGGVAALTSTLAAELAPRGVRVNCVEPGMLNVGMGQRVNHERAKAIRSRVPLGRFGEGSEAASAVLFLASDEASYIVGHRLVVDGGLSL